MKKPYDDPKYLTMWGHKMDECALLFSQVSLDDLLTNAEQIDEAANPTLVYEFSSHTWHRIEFPSPKLVQV